jgi:hypothetical protein
MPPPGRKDHAPGRAVLPVISGAVMLYGGMRIDKPAVSGRATSMCAIAT